MLLRNFLTYLLMLWLIYLSNTIEAQIINFPDANFKAALLAHSRHGNRVFDYAAGVEVEEKPL